MNQAKLFLNIVLDENFLKDFKKRIQHLEVSSNINGNLSENHNKKFELLIEGLADYWEKKDNKKLQELSKSFASISLEANYSPSMMIEIIDALKNTFHDYFRQKSLKKEELSFNTSKLNKILDLFMKQLLDYHYAFLKEFEENLKVKEDAIASSINAMCFADFEGNLTYVNDSFLKMWGFNNSSEVLGKPLTSFYEDENRAWKVFEVVTRTKGQIGELVAKRKDSSMFDVQLRLNIVTDKKNNPVCLMGSFIDITEQKMLEQQLHQYMQGLEQLVQEKADQLLEKERQMLQQERAATIGRLAGSIGHDINNPLQHISGTVEIVFNLLERESKLQEEIKPLLETILYGCERINETCSRLRRVSRMGTMEPFNLYDTLESAINMTRNRWKKVCRTVSREYLTEGPIVTRGVEGDIAHVFMNLLVNAAQAIEKEGIITLRVYQLSNEPFITVEVEDNGSGIPIEIQEKLGKEVVSTKPFEEGTGLGLLGSYDIVKRHRGTIAVKSTVGNGTVFTVKLPSYEKT
ncbi:MAG: nitrogen regulation protein NR(II) [Candidatus Odinarchaeota archaeon]